MSDNKQFDTKWSSTLNKDKQEEYSVFVPRGKKPKTQRQLFLYQYYTFIKSKLSGGISRSLEMGCGRGTVSLYFNLYDGVEATMCDMSESAIELAKKNVALHKAQAQLDVCDAEKTPYNEGEFDLVFSIGLLEHLDDYQGIVNEKFRVLKSGGTVASLNIPKKKSIQELNNWYRKVLGLFVKKETLKPDYYRNTDAPEQFEEAFEKAGFVDVEIVPMTPLPLYTPLWPWVERIVAWKYRFVLFLRSLFMKHPFTASRRASQAHFVIAKKL